MFLQISLNFCPLNLLLLQSHQAEITIVTRLFQGRNNVARVRVEPRSCDQGRRENDTFTLSATQPTNLVLLFPLSAKKDLIRLTPYHWQPCVLTFCDIRKE